MMMRRTFDPVLTCRNLALAAAFAVPGLPAAASNDGVTTIEEFDCLAQREQQEACCGPCPTIQVAPQYPDIEKNLDGAVHLYVTVDTQGKPKDVMVINSTHKVFEAPSVEALKLWVFKPGVCQGRTIEQAVRIRMSFKAN